MNMEIILPIATATSALLGVGLTAFVQMRSQRGNQRFQLASDAAKHRRERADQASADAIQRLTEAHKLLSKIARDFSPTSLNILWGSGMTGSEYDLRYLQSCEEMDDLRAFAAIHEPSLEEDVEKLNSQMSYFWGNFKNVLYLSHKGERVDHNTSCFSDADAAAREAGSIAKLIKSQIAQLASRAKRNS